MLRIFHSNSIGSFTLIPLLIIAFVARLAFLPVDAHQPWVSPFFAFEGSQFAFWMQDRIVQAVVSAIVIFICTILITRFNSRFLILPGQTLLPATIFIVLVSAWLPIQIFSPAWIFFILFILAIWRLFVNEGQSHGAQFCFDAAFIFSIGTLFFLKGIWLFVLFFFIMYYLRFLNFKTIVAALLGLFLPYLFMWFWFFWYNSGMLFFKIIGEGFIRIDYDLHMNLQLYIYLGFLSFITLLGLFTVLSRINTKKIIIRNYIRIIIWSMLIIVAMWATHFSPTEMLLCAFFPGAFIVAHLFDTLKSKFWKETLFLLLILSSVAAQYFLR